MSNLSAFLNPVSVAEEKEVVISKRFLDGMGKPAPFKIRSISQVENESISKKCSGYRKVKGQQVEYFDNIRYLNSTVDAYIVQNS